MKLEQIHPSIISRKNTYFHKIFRYIAVTTCLLFFCLTFIITLFTMCKYTEEMENRSIQSLHASVSVSESTLGSLYHYCYFLFYNNATVNNILYADSFSSELSMEFAALKDDFLSYYDLIHSIYLINFQADMAFSNVTTCQSLEAFYDQDILLLLADSSLDTYHYLFLPRSMEAGAPSDVISLIFRYQNGNAFVVNVSLDSYEALLNRDSNAMWPDTLVINSYGHAINGNQEIRFASNVSDTDWYQRILASSQTDGRLSATFHSRRCTIFYRKNAAFHFTYITILDASPFSTKNTMLVSTLLSFVIFTFLGLGLSLFLSYTLYLPINNMITLLKSYDKRTRTSQPDEISYLTDAVTNLVHTSQKTQKQIRLAKQADCLRHILTVADYYDSVKNDTLEQYGISMDSDNYQVILFSLDRSAMLLSSNPSDHKLMLDSLQNIASELLPGSFCLEVEDGILAYILFPDTDAPDTFLRQATQTQQCMSDYFQETVTVGIGLVCDSPAELHESYTQAKLALRYRFLFGGNSILNYAELSVHNTANLMLVQEQKEIIAAVFSCREALALEKLQAYFATLQDIHIDSIIMNIMALNSSFQNAEMQASLRSLGSLSYDSAPYSHYTLQEILAQFNQRITTDIAQLQEIKKNTAARPQIIEEVTAYVDRNLCQADLTVENIATHVQLSTNYLRNIFKEHMGITLSKYITDKKIQYACKILVETEDSIQSICERLDFTSANYFYAYFKKNTGMTPNQYWEKYRTDPAASESATPQ